MNKKEALTQLEIMATNATGRLGSAKSEEEKALLNKHIEALNMAMDALKDCKPKTGGWVEVNSYESEHHSVTDMRCNICGKYSSVVLPHKTRFTYPYCPNCGAKMERSNNEDRAD